MLISELADAIASRVEDLKRKRISAVATEIRELSKKTLITDDMLLFEIKNATRGLHNTQKYPPVEAVLRGICEIVRMRVDDNTEAVFGKSVNVGDILTECYLSLLGLGE